MKITKIGFGYTKNEGNYQNSKIYLEAELEDWESASESLDILRSQVAEEMKLPEQLHDLRNQVAHQRKTLRDGNILIKEAKEELERARRAWDNFSEFLTGHGVDPETLTLENFSALQDLHTGTPGQELTIVQTYDTDDYDDEDDDYDDEDE